MLAPYLRGLGYSGSMYGLLGSSAVFTGAFSTLVGGYLSDRVGSRPILAAGLLFQSMALALLSTGSVVLVAVGFMANGFGNGLAFTSWRALISRSGRDEELHYTFSYVSAASTFGGGIGSFLGWLPVLASRGLGLLLLEAYRYTLLLSSLSPLTAIAVAWGVREYRGEASRGGRVRLRGAFTGRFYLIVAIEVAIGFGAAMSIHNIDYYFAAKYNVNSAQLGTVVGLQQLAMAALMLYMPRLSDRVGGPLRVYIAVSSASVPLLIAMTLTNNFLLAASLFLIRSVLMNVATPLFDAFVMRLVPRERRGIASSILSLSWTLPAGGGRAVGGWLLDKNLELPLRLTAAIYAAAIAALTAMFRDELGGGERPPSTPLYTSKKPQ